jgi:hypothetical protein
VPAHQLTEIIRTDHYKVHSTGERARMIQHRGQLLDLKPLAETAGIGNAGLLTHGQVCWVVDEVVGQRYFALKRAGSPASHSTYTVLGSGESVPVVSLISGISGNSGMAPQTEEQPPEARHAA